ncbi:ribonuclease P protein component [Ureaplasma miroungigenitalium]|uniref:Ribonuclease P protein component n=1 Tax=Ureaplasma miroungigenitalium TaxID=1042321 RepID=A0ABT3BNB8_9BACT|nr:ribonuclease P protein component [Ureaplasma miroungigenitalium]MCV3728724.1 ribonuclease P protein component [Ureaplasma miroungigenitalium]MCV3734488.1 ribonuclease P protein component [Ureaplasma miroungigenitalium]
MAKFFSLKKNLDILKIIKKHQKISTKIMSFYYAFSEEDKPCVAISVSKKHFRLATTRNRIKRLIRAYLNNLKCDFSYCKMVIIVNPSFTDGVFNLNASVVEKAVLKIMKIRKEKRWEQK